MVKITYFNKINFTLSLKRIQNKIKMNEIEKNSTLRFIINNLCILYLKYIVVK